MWTPDLLVVDVASAPIEGAELFVEPAKAPSNYKDAEKIAAYVKEETARRVAEAGLDLDLARLTAFGFQDADGCRVDLCKTETDERLVLTALGESLRRNPDLRLVTYNGFRFDLPLLMRRARYLGVPFPKINLDRYRSPHRDLLLDLTDRDPSRSRPLGFYVRRLGWTDLVKPLEGAEESRVHETGRWDELARSVTHDVTATARLAEWLGLTMKGATAPEKATELVS